MYCGVFFTKAEATAAQKAAKVSQAAAAAVKSIKGPTLICLKSSWLVLKMKLRSIRATTEGTIKTTDLFSEISVCRDRCRASLFRLPSRCRRPGIRYALSASSSASINQSLCWACEARAGPVSLTSQGRYRLFLQCSRYRDCDSGQDDRD